MVKKDSVNPLNVLDARRVDFCPPYFESTTISPTYNLAKALDEWIYENLSGRYYIGNAVDLDGARPFKSKIYTMSAQKTETNPNDLNIQDLATMKGIIEIASERSAFKPAEMAAVGIVYNKLDLFLKAVEEQQKQAQAAAQATTAPTEDPANG